MANRLNAPNQFETLSPPWILSQLDTNFTQNQAAWNDSSLGFVNGICTDTGAANAYVITAGNLPFGAPSAYNPGMTLFFVPVNANTGASTIAVGALGTVAILNKAGLALSGGELPASKMVGITYNNSAPVGFRICTFCQLSLQFTNTATITVNCSGYDAVSLLVIWTSTTTSTIVLNNVASGVPVTIALTNAAGSTQTLSIKLTDTGANNFSTVAVGYGPTLVASTFSSATTVLQSGATVNSFSISNASTVVMTGTVAGPVATQNLYLGLS